MRIPAIGLVVLVACGSSNPALPDSAPAADAPAQSGATPVIPQPTGTCPAIVDGDVMFAPAGIPPRKVKLALGTPTGNGPLILYWHATGSSPVEAAYALGSTLTAITQAGGIVATPYADPTAGTFEWFIVNQSPKQDDFLVADEIVACLAQAHAIDTNHIHSMGMSAGGLQTTATSFIRSSYIASVSTFSGGVPPGFSPPIQNPDNKFAALIFDGGTSDNVFGVDFKAASEQYRSMLDASGHFAAICDHGMGHNIPLDAAPSVATFFTANAFGAWPSPYSAGLPPTFPAYCSL